MLSTNLTKCGKLQNFFATDLIDVGTIKEIWFRSMESNNSERLQQVHKLSLRKNFNSHLFKLCEIDQGQFKSLWDPRSVFGAGP